MGEIDHVSGAINANNPAVWHMGRYLGRDFAVAAPDIKYMLIALQSQFGYKFPAPVELGF
jgi:hypothetical protein